MKATEILEVWHGDDVPDSLGGPYWTGRCEVKIVCFDRSIGDQEDDGFTPFFVIQREGEAPLALCEDCHEWLDEVYGQGEQVDV